MPEHSTRKDAVRNRNAVLAAADALFDRGESPEDVTMADVAAAAGVGKGTLFRAFGDREGCSSRSTRPESNRSGKPWKPDRRPWVPPPRRSSACPPCSTPSCASNSTTVALALALEETGSSSPYQAAHYERWHGLLQAMLEQIPGLDDGGFTAHALLAATRADLIEYLAGHERIPRERLRAQLASFTAAVLGGWVAG